jgi:hypothetical protein
MNVRSFIPKDNQEMPDSYNVKIYYITGKTDDFCVVSLFPIPQTQTIEIWLKDDLMLLIPIQSILKIEYDKKWSKIVEISKKEK